MPEAAAFFNFCGAALFSFKGEQYKPSGCLGQEPVEAPYTMDITTAFGPMESMPEPYTCLGRNISFPLAISGIPESCRSLTLIFEDLDADPVPWTHWLVFNIPPTTRQVPEGQIPKGATEGLANNHSFGYEGPCPRYFKGTHHYRLRLYALDRQLPLAPETEKEAVLEAMEGHVLSVAEMTCRCTAPA